MRVTAPIFTWKGNSAGGNLFSDAAAWTPGSGPPGANDVALFPGINDIIQGNGTVGELVVRGQPGSPYFNETDFSGTITALGLGTGPSVIVNNSGWLNMTTGGQLDAGNIVLTNGELSASGIRNVAPVLLYAASVFVGYGTHGGGDLNIGLDATLNASGSIIVNGGSMEVGGYVSIGGQAASSGALVLGTGLGNVGSAEIAHNGNLYADTIVLGANQARGFLSIGSQALVTDRNALHINSGSVLTVFQGEVDTASAVIAQGGILSGSGEVDGFNELANTTLVNDGTIEATGSGLTIFARHISGHGTFAVATHAMLSFVRNIDSPATLAFLGTNALIQVGNLASGTVVQGFGVTDTLSMFNASAIAFDRTTGTLRVDLTTGGADILHFAGDFTGETFALDHGAITVTKSSAPHADISIPHASSAIHEGWWHHA